MEEETIARLDLGIAYSSDKLANLHALLVHLLSWEFDLHGYLTITTIEKALVFDLLSSFLDSEIKAVEDFIHTLKADIVHTRYRTSSDPRITTTTGGGDLQDKLCFSEKLLKQSQARISEMKIQLSEFQLPLSPLSKIDTWEKDQAIGTSSSCQILNVASGNSTAAKLVHFIGMLENSLAREEDLDKKLSQLRLNEEQLSLKLHNTQQVAFHMEEAAELVWGRFVEADNLSEILMGISKDLVGQLKNIEFYLTSSNQRENELKYKLKHTTDQLESKEASIEKLRNKNSEYVIQISQVVTLRDKVKLLEEKLENSEIRLKHKQASYEESQEKLSEIGSVVATLKECVSEAESRAESAESKVTELTDANLELTEETNFLKSNSDTNVEKVSLLEKQLRESEIQLQHAKASLEASQEQQNMLYSAIWDMETLIEDLKSKVSKAEIKVENAEEQCVRLSEANWGLTKRLSSINARMEVGEMSLDQVNKSKVVNAKEIDLNSALMMDLVVQLSTERKRIKKQMFIDLHRGTRRMAIQTPHISATQKSPRPKAEQAERFAKNSNDTIDAALIFQPHIAVECEGIFFHSLKELTRSARFNGPVHFHCVAVSFQAD